MIERRSRNGEMDRDELEPSYAESVRRFNEKRRQMARLEEQAAKLMEEQPKGAA